MALLPPFLRLAAAQRIPGMPDTEDDSGDEVVGGDVPSTAIQHPAPVPSSTPAWEDAYPGALGSAGDIYDIASLDLAPEESQALAFDLHNDPEAVDAMLPLRPLPGHRDESHPVQGTRLGKLLQVLEMAAVGGLAGAGQRTVGGGFHYGLQAVQNLQALQMRRQQDQDFHRLRRAQAQRIELQNAGIPQQQADLSQYRAKRGDYLQAQIDRLRKGGNDRFRGQYQGSDGRMHFVFQNPDGEVYEQVGGQFYQKPQPTPEPKPPRIIVMGSQTYQWDENATHANGRKGGWRVIGPAPRFDANGQPIVPPRTARAPQSYFGKVEQWKGREAEKILRDTGLSDDEKAQHLQEIQDYYESAIQAGGGTVEHFDVRQHYGRPQLGSAADPLGIR